MPKRAPKEVPSHGKIHKIAGRSGKGFIALGNLGTGLLFFQSFWLTNKLSGLVVSIMWFLGSYAIGMTLIDISNKRRKK